MPQVSGRSRDGAFAVLSLFLLTYWCWLRWRKARQMPALTVQSSKMQKSSGADPSKVEVHLDLKKDELELQPAVSQGPVLEQL